MGGSIEYADGFIPKAYELIREHGGLCIADEVQTGFGRTGTNYWGFQNHGVIPDIVTMAKGIGNGFPLAAVVTTPEIAQTLSQRLHFNTYGGNPIVSAVGRAVLRTIDDENLQENCAVVGGHLKQRLLQLKDKHDIIGDVRGRGLMLGVELVTDRTTKEPATAETAHVFERLRDLGVLIGKGIPAKAAGADAVQPLPDCIRKGGIHGNMFRTKPPMCFTKEDADFVADAMDHALAEL